MQTKINLKLYDLTCMQANSQNRKHINYHSPHAWIKHYYAKGIKLDKGNKRKQSQQVR